MTLFIDLVKEALSAETDLIVLEKIKRVVEEKIREVKKAKHIKFIQESVEEDSYCVTNRKYDITGFKCFSMKYFVDLYAWDLENQSDEEIGATSNKQDRWVSLLDVKYDANEHDKLVDIVSDWDRDDKDSPATARGYMYLYLYFKENQKVPLVDQDFYLIFENGHVRKKTKDMDFNKIKHEYFLYIPPKEEEEEEEEEEGEEEEEEEEGEKKEEEKEGEEG